MTILPTAPHFDFPLTTSLATPNTPVQIPLEEIPNLREVSRQVRAVFQTFGARTLGAYCLGDRIRVYISPLKDKGSLLAHDLDVVGVMARTAEELSANSVKEVPLPHAKALTSQSLVGVLRAVATTKPAAHAAPTFNDGSGAHPIPLLSPTNFVQPVASRDRTISTTMHILGCIYSKKSGIRYFLTGDRIEVSFSPDLEEVMKGLPITAIRDGLWFTGTICQDDRDQWATVPGGRIVRQETT